MVYILLGPGFEEAEALVTADVLRRGGVSVALTGIGSLTVTGAHGITVTADMAVENAALSAGDTVVLPGGLGGVASIEGNAAAMALIREAAGRDDLWLAAICAAPTLLARAGLLKAGVQVVCYPGMEGELTAAGAAPPMDQPAVVCGRLVTSQAPGTAYDFALTLLAALAGQDTAHRIRDDLHYKG